MCNLFQRQSDVCLSVSANWGNALIDRVADVLSAIRKFAGRNVWIAGNTEVILSFAPGATPEQLEDFNRALRLVAFCSKQNRVSLYEREGFHHPQCLALVFLEMRSL